MKFSAGLAAVAALVSVQGVSAIAEWGQCGGINWGGSGTCDSGLTCTVVNDWYYQCLKSTSIATTTKATATPTTTNTSATSTATGRVKFKHFGVNESCAEFGIAVPGTLGVDYTWPTQDSIDYFMAKGFNTFRIPFMMERISPPSTGLTGAFDPTYLAALKSIASYVTSKGGYAVLDPHNYLRYNGTVITDTAAFSTWWKNLATLFKSDPKIIFDINNEPNGVTADVAFAANQAGVNAIRAAGATTQLILVEGTSWSGAHSWVSSGNAAAYSAIKDPYNNIAIEMHQYLDADSSGSGQICESSTIGVERVAEATAWLKANNLRGFLGEIGAGPNDLCIAAIKELLTALQAPGTPWLGALWWAAGPWWGTYYLSIEPPSGGAVARVLPEALLPFV